MSTLPLLDVEISPLVEILEPPAEVHNLEFLEQQRLVPQLQRMYILRELFIALTVELQQSQQPQIVVVEMMRILKWERQLHSKL